MFIKKFIILILIINTIRSQNYFGSKGYTEFKTGNINILISIPHDGGLKPVSIIDRPKEINDTMPRDLNTRPFAEELAAELNRLTFKTPFMVFNNLHRVKMEPNVQPNDSCSSLNVNKECETAVNEYHNFISGFKTNMSKVYKQLLIIDIHGNAHAENWTELGYILSKFDLNKPVLANLTKSSVQGLNSLYNYGLERLIRGNISLGAFMQKFSYRVVPSPSILSPGTGGYFNGGYITFKHKSINTNTIQMELASFIRRNSTTSRYHAKNIANAVYQFYNIHKFKI
ncbi:unnamed protein product [Brachionus calyciflorus]|uniref:N-formylglutamate amidohydrolase n=1 Tax=Brachionus calyciflorus TaxID=104777 RepID=A0A813QRG2_9BILA|nr:unnamed protein product [Brachionus calyciflorus]